MQTAVLIRPVQAKTAICRYARRSCIAGDIHQRTERANIMLMSETWIRWFTVSGPTSGTHP